MVDKEKFENKIRIKTGSGFKELNFYQLNDVFIVKSVEFYQILGLQPSHYTRWVQRQILKHGDLEDDYFYSADNMWHPYYRKSYKLFLTIDFCLTLCLPMYNIPYIKELRWELKRLQKIQKVTTL